MINEDSRLSVIIKLVIVFMLTLSIAGCTHTKNNQESYDFSVGEERQQYTNRPLVENEYTQNKLGFLIGIWQGFITSEKWETKSFYVAFRKTSAIHDNYISLVMNISTTHILYAHIPLEQPEIFVEDCNLEIVGEKGYDKCVFKLYRNSKGELNGILRTDNWRGVFSATQILHNIDVRKLTGTWIETSYPEVQLEIDNTDARYFDWYYCRGKGSIDNGNKYNSYIEFNIYIERCEVRKINGNWTFNAWSIDENNILASGYVIHDSIIYNRLHHFRRI